MNVAFVYPEVYDLARYKEKRKEFPPFGILYLSAVAEQAGHNVRIFKISPSAEKLNLMDFDAVAYSIPSSATYGVVKKSRFISSFSPNCLIMVGGVHANFYPEETFYDIQPDILGVGEGEATIIRLLEVCKSRMFSHIPGILFIKRGKLVRTAEAPIINNIDTLPMPARHLLPREDLIMNDRLAKTNLSIAHVMLSRGCPFPCRFCAASQTKMQYRSGSNAREELISLIENYGISGFAIVDDNFIVNRKKVSEICSSIADLNLKWSALSRVDTINEELLTQMKMAGCIEVKFGVESGSQRILDSMRKNIKIDDIRLALKNAAKVGIESKIFIIHGFPGENAESTADTIMLLRELRPLISRVALFRFVPLPGTFVYNNPEQFNVRGTNKDLDWDGNWERYHIHHNTQHWWGSDEDFDEMNQAFNNLSSFINAEWPARSEHKIEI